MPGRSSSRAAGPPIAAGRSVQPDVAADHEGSAVSTVGQPYVPEQYAFADPAAVLKPVEETRPEPLAAAPVPLPPVTPGLMPSTTPVSRASLAAPQPVLDAPT